MLDKLLKRLQGKAQEYTLDAIKNPGKGRSFDYGVHHGVLKGFDLVEQLIQELQEEEEDDENE